MEFSQDLNICNYCHIYRKAIRTTDYLAMKGIYNTNPNIWCSDFPMKRYKIMFEDYRGLSFNRMCKFFYSHSFKRRKTHQNAKAFVALRCKTHLIRGLL